MEGNRGTVAPALATALGGPLAGVAVRAIAERVLGKPEASEADVAAAVTGASPELFLKLKQADQDLARAMANAGVKFEEIEAQDRASACAMRMVTHDWVPGLLAVVFVSGFFARVWVILRYTIPAENRDAVNLLLGALVGAVTTILSFYFGSSRGSREKDAILGRVAGK